MATDYCGTGSGTFIHPDDPDLNNSVLIAKPAFGGIDLVWTYPEHNSHAVAHVAIFRSLNPDPDTRINLQVVNGTTFFDRIEGEPKTYYYWIQFVSINGTSGDLIGPSSATSRYRIGETIADLTGRIDSGMLAQSLTTIIGGISANETALKNEQLSRIDSDGNLSLAFSDLQINVNSVQTLVQNEVVELREADRSIVNSLDLMFAQLNDTNALILEEKTVRATEDSSLAQSLTTLESNVGDDIAQVQNNLQTTINDVGDIQASYTTVVRVNGLIGGFGIGNDGEIVTAGFDVDRFFVGRSTNKKKPFIIENNEVFIDDAAINKLTVNKLRSEDNSLAFKNGRLRADLIDVQNLQVEYGNIQNVDIQRADIRNAAVDTLQIEGNAVTVPSARTTSYHSKPSVYTDYVDVAIYLDKPGWVYASCSASIFYGTGWGDAFARLLIDSTVLQRQGGAEGFVTCALSGAVYVSAGYHRAYLQFSSPGQKGTMTEGSIFMMGVKR